MNIRDIEEKQVIKLQKAGEKALKNRLKSWQKQHRELTAIEAFKIGFGDGILSAFSLLKKTLQDKNRHVK